MQDSPGSVVYIDESSPFSLLQFRCFVCGETRHPDY